MCFITIKFIYGQSTSINKIILNFSITDTDASSEPDAKKAKLESDELKSENKENEENESEPAKPKLTKEEKRALLFDKRTVGAKFDEELGEYFIRMSQNLSLKNYIERD